MALSYSRLGGDEAGVVLGQLCNALTALFSRARGKMTLSKLSEDEQRIIFGHLCSRASRCTSAAPAAGCGSRRMRYGSS